MVEPTDHRHPGRPRPLTVPAPGHVLAIDVGTSAVRVSAVSLTGTILHTARRSLVTHTDGDVAELDPAALWGDVMTLLREMDTALGHPAAIGVACQLGMVGVDQRLEPVTAIRTWQDRRATQAARDLERDLGDDLWRIAGRRLAPEHAAARAAWMARHEPDVWSRTRWLLAPKDLLVARLTGAVVTDATSASYSALFDVRQRAWSGDLAAVMGVPLERLPPVQDGDSPAGGLTADVAAATGIPAGTPVAVGGPDGSVALVGSGAVTPGRTVDVAGSTDVVLRVLERPIDDPHGRAILNASLLAGMWTVGGPTGLTGGAIAWLATLLGYASVEAAYADLGERVAALPPGAGGVVFRTSLSGERFPTWATDRSGSISGLRPGHGSAHVLRAAEEGAAFVVREGLDALHGLGIATDVLRMSGGSVHRAEAMRVRADALQVPLEVVRQAEATTLGVGVLAAVSAGRFAAATQAVSVMVDQPERVEPNPAVAMAYDSAYRAWQRAGDQHV